MSTLPASLFPLSKRELLRLERDRQATAQATQAKADRAVRRAYRAESIRPTPGSQLWAETRGDDLGLSADY